MGIEVVDDLHLKSLATHAGKAQLGVDTSLPSLSDAPLSFFVCACGA